MNSLLKNNISVIIPVYNAAAFVAKAVASALTLEDVREVLLIEDGSTDNSLQICKELEKQNDKISLFTHPDNENKGAGASRNMGIENATGDFIAFLDADDYFLPDRFEAEKSIFETQPDVDGVYGALGFHYYSEEGKQKYEQASFAKLTTLNGKPSPTELFLSLTWLHPEINGHFHIGALTVRREIFDNKAEKFSNLTMHEDTVFIIELSLTCKLVAGKIDIPVALRGVHDSNRIVNNKNPKSRLLMWRELHEWAKKSKRNKSYIQKLQALLVAEKIRLASKSHGRKIWLMASFTNKYFRTQSVFFDEGAKKLFGRKMGTFISNVRHRLHVFFL